MILEIIVGVFIVCCDLPVIGGQDKQGVFPCFGAEFVADADPQINQTAERMHLRAPVEGSAHAGIDDRPVLEGVHGITVIFQISLKDYNIQLIVHR